MKNSKYYYWKKLGKGILAYIKVLSKNTKTKLCIMITTR